MLFLAGRGKMVSSINNRIRAVRQALKISQREFCKGIYLSHSFFAQIESGTKNANERIYELIAAKYNVNKQWLITGKGEMFSAPPPDMELNQLIEIFQELDPLFREYIIQQIKQLSKIQKEVKPIKGKGKQAKA
jgi:transcriptional regulator with XRE-family HTH domain